MTAEEIRKALSLEPHPEGGAFRRVYTAPTADPDGRATAGSIYFLLEGREISHFHRIDCDELWYYHLGCGMAITWIEADGSFRRGELGPDLAGGQSPMVRMPAGVIFAAENLDPRGFTLAGCMTTPQFTYDSFELFRQSALLAAYPAQEAEIRRLAMPDTEA